MKYSKVFLSYWDALIYDRYLHFNSLSFLNIKLCTRGELKKFLATKDSFFVAVHESDVNTLSGL